MMRNEQLCINISYVATLLDLQYDGILAKWGYVDEIL